MSVSTIDPESSVLSYPQWQAWEHTFTGTNSPYKFTLTSGGVPTGMVFQPPVIATGDESADTLSLVSGDMPVNGQMLVFTSLSGGAGLSTNTIYFARDCDPDAHTWSMAATPGGALINFTTHITAATLIRPGFLTGAATVPGITKIRLVATNGTGDSAEVMFVIGIEPAAATPDPNSDMVYDMGTNLVARQTTATLPDTSKPEDGPDEKDPTKFVAVMAIKDGDDYLMRIKLVKSGTILDLAVTALELNLKEFEPDGKILTGNTFVKQGTGVDTNYLLYVQAVGVPLDAALTEYEDDLGTYFWSLAELKVTYSNPEAVGPDSVIRSSKTFRVRVDRNISRA